MGDLFSVEHGHGVAVTAAHYAAYNSAASEGLPHSKPTRHANARTTVFEVGFMDVVGDALSGLLSVGIN